MKSKNIIQIILFLLIALPFVHAAPPVPDTNYSFADFLKLDFKIGLIQSSYLTMTTTPYAYNFPIYSYDIKIKIDKNDITLSTFSFINRRTNQLIWAKEKWKKCVSITGTTQCQTDFYEYAQSFLTKNNKRILNRLINLQETMRAVAETSPSVD